MKLNEKLIIASMLIGVIVIPAIGISITRKELKQDALFRFENELTNEEIVEKSRFCIDNGLNAEVIWKGSVDGKWPVGIRCTPGQDGTDLIQGKKSQAVIIN